jgi:hypothetical protein
MEKDKFVILSKDVANAIFSYLGKRPCSEVMEIVQNMMDDINQNAAKLDIVSKDVVPVPDDGPNPQQLETEQPAKPIK